MLALIASCLVWGAVTPFYYRIPEYEPGGAEAVMDMDKITTGDIR